MLKGKRIRLRPVRKSDLEMLLRWFNDQEVTQYLQQYLPMTELGEEKWIEDLCLSRRNTDIVFVIEVDESEGTKAIGTCGLHHINWKDRDVDFGIAIGEKKYWSRGYGTEAMTLLAEYGFEELNLHRISSAAYDFNERSIKAQQKVGFQIEGCVRSAIFKKGKYRNKIILGLLRDEWRKK